MTVPGASVHLSADGEAASWLQGQSGVSAQHFYTLLPRAHIDFQLGIVLEEEAPTDGREVGCAGQIVGEVCAGPINPSVRIRNRVINHGVVVVMGVEEPANLELLGIA